jgi:hypothetical protein
MESIAQLPAVGMKKQVTCGIAAQDAIIEIILLDIFQFEFRVSILEMQQSAIGVARTEGVTENPVIIVHLSLNGKADKIQKKNYG